MSWYSDGEPFDEHDPPWCNSCRRENPTEAQCRLCSELHEEAEKETEDTEDVV